MAEEEQQEYYGEQEATADDQQQYDESAYQQEAVGGTETYEEDTTAGAGGEAENAGGGETKDTDDDDRKIFVGGLSFETTNQDLKNYFSKYGEVTECVLKTDPETGRSRCFGFIVFKDSESLDKVLEVTDHKLHGRNIDPKKANPKKREPNLKVFVGGLNPDTAEQEIREHFEVFGKIAEMDLPVDLNKKRRGFCFVKFESEDVLKKVIEDRMQTIGGKECEVKRSTPRQDFRRGGFRGGWGGPGGFQGGRGGRGGRGRGGWNQGYGNQGYGYNQGYGGYNQGYGGYNPGYGAYDNSYYGYNQGYNGGGWGGSYDQSYGGYGNYGYDYSGWSGYGTDDAGQNQGSGGYGKMPAKRGGHGYHPYGR